MFLIVLLLAQGSVTMTWTRPTVTLSNIDDLVLDSCSGNLLRHGNEIRGYVIRWGLEPGKYSDSAVIGDTTGCSQVVDNSISYTIDGLDRGWNYYSRIWAFNNSGLSEPGAEVSFFLPAVQETKWDMPFFGVILSLADSTVWAATDTAVFQGDTTGVVNLDFLIAHSQFSIFQADSFRIKMKPVRASDADYERFIYDRDVTIVEVVGDVTYQIQCRAIEDEIESIYSPARYFRIEMPVTAVDFEAFKMILRMPFAPSRE